jgi:hypothetical protein
VGDIARFWTAEPGTQLHAKHLAVLGEVQKGVALSYCRGPGAILGKFLKFFTQNPAFFTFFSIRNWN